MDMFHLGQIARVEFEDIVLDIDKEGFITGIQIFNASNMFKVEKESLNEIKNWNFEIVKRNKIIERV